MNRYPKDKVNIKKVSNIDWTNIFEVSMKLLIVVFNSPFPLVDTAGNDDTNDLISKNKDNVNSLRVLYPNNECST